MAPADSSGHWPSSQRDDRIRRNVACVNCRNSKVRCRQSTTPGQPCQRCGKLDLSCVVDKAHKRVTKRSKLEQLEQELDAIRQAVGPNSGDNGRPPHSPRETRGSYPERSRPSSVSQRRAPLLVTPKSGGERTPAVETPTPLVAKRPPKNCPSEPRSIGSYVLSGEDIDWYFDKYLECFHPMAPVLCKYDPDECYRCNSTLFWVVIYIVCRRYARDPLLFTTVIDNLSREIWLLLSNPVTNLEAIHSLILISAWPLPTVRFATDPTAVFPSITTNFCMQFGLHTGKGSHGEFCVGTRLHQLYTDEAASCTWLMTCILGQRSAYALGHPPRSLQHNDTPVREALSSPMWKDLIATFDLQKFLNRVHGAIASHILTNGSVAENIVTHWEDEFETFKGVMELPDTDLARFYLLSARLEIQSYYFSHAPQSPGPNFALNSARAVLTAKDMVTMISDIGPAKFLAHTPHWVFRSVVDACYLVVSALHSMSPPPLDDVRSTDDPDSPAVDPAESLAQKCIQLLSACSVREGDLAYRSNSIIQGFWSCRDLIPICEPPAMSWTMRLGAGVTFWCLERLHRNLSELRGTSEKARQALKNIQPGRFTGTLRENDLAGSTQTQPTDADALADPSSMLDWSLFMDDFGWGTTEGIFMGLS